ncbi:MAG TPA: PepSY domain-containing protein [Dongiaceae bacterium]|jgi:uncharacterized membrane protein YkoI
MKTYAFAVCAILALARPAFADQEENDALQINHAKISLADAIAAAEAKTGGRASRAEFEKAKEGWVFDVETVSAKSVNDVHVNAETGAVLSVTEDQIDQDEGEQDEAD